MSRSLLEKGMTIRKTGGEVRKVLARRNPDHITQLEQRLNVSNTENGSEHAESRISG